MRRSIAAWASSIALCCAAATTGCASWQRQGEPLNARLDPNVGARYVHTGSGRAIYTEVRGDDTSHPPVLLVHGYASNHDVWDPLEPTLRERRRTINVDLPGFGWSSRTEGDYSPAALADDLADVLRSLGVSQADVVAHSWGSSVTLALALEHPAMVRRFVLIGGWIYDEQIPPFFRWARLPGVGETLFSAYYTERPADRFPDAFEDPSIVSQELVDMIERSFDRPGTSRAALAAARGQCFRQLQARYRQVRQPALLLWGADDHVSRARFGERLSHELPDAEFVSLPRAGHFPMVEAAHATREAVSRFLDAAPQQEAAR